VHLVEATRLGEVRGDPAAADDPKRAVAGRSRHLAVELADRGVRDPHVHPLALGQPQLT
jgi:hypothetical protein